MLSNYIFKHFQTWEGRIYPEFLNKELTDFTIS